MGYNIKSKFNITNRMVACLPPLCKGRGTAFAVEGLWFANKTYSFGNPSVTLRRQLPLHKGAKVFSKFVSSCRGWRPDIPREIWRYKFLRICDISSMRYTYGAICPKGQEITGQHNIKSYPNG